MSSIADVLNSELEKIKQELIDKHIALGMKASGNWVESLRVEIKETVGAIYGADYTKQLIEGRPPGKFPPIDSIKKWIYDKKIDFDIPLNSLAFLIARKIAKKGTDYFIQQGTDLVSGVITEQRIKQITINLERQIIKELSIIQNEMKY